VAAPIRMARSAGNSGPAAGPGRGWPRSCNNSSSRCGHSRLLGSGRSSKAVRPAVVA